MKWKRGVRLCRGCCVKTKQIVLRGEGGNTHSCTFLSPGKHSNITLFAVNVNVEIEEWTRAWQRMRFVGS